VDLLGADTETEVSKRSRSILYPGNPIDGRSRGAVMPELGSPSAAAHCTAKSGYGGAERSGMTGTEFPAGTSGELGDVVETLKRGLLGPPEPGDLAIDQKRSQLQVALVRARIASHGPTRLLRLADRRHITSHFAKTFFFEFRWKQAVAQHFSLCILVKCPPHLPEMLYLRRSDAATTCKPSSAEELAKCGCV